MTYTINVYFHIVEACYVDIPMHKIVLIHALVFGKIVLLTENLID